MTTWKNTIVLIALTFADIDYLFILMLQINFKTYFKNPCGESEKTQKSSKVLEKE